MTKPALPDLNSTTDSAGRAPDDREPTPFAKLVGFRITSESKDRLEGELSVRADLLNLNKTLHGGAMMALADHMGGVGAHLNLSAGQTTTTIESKTNFLRPLFVGDLVKAVAIPLHRGRRTQIWQTTLYAPNGKVAAIVTQTQMNLEPSKAD